MSTQIQSARKGVLTPQIQFVAQQEGHAPEWVRQRVAEGRIVIPCNPFRQSQKVVAALTRRDSRWTEHMDLLLFPEKAREIRTSRMPAKEETCTMCGDFCANRKGMELFRDCMADDKRL